MKKAIAIFLVLIMIFALCACSMLETPKETLVTSETSPNGNYTLCLYQVGAPAWSFGPVDAKLVLIDTNGNQIDEETFRLSNDGTDVAEGNIYSITWMDDQVVVVMREFDTTQTYTHSLSYSK